MDGEGEGKCRDSRVVYFSVHDQKIFTTGETDLTKI